MKLLLDTHVLLWAAAQPKRLSASVRKLLNDPAHQLLFSAASIWEIATKSALGRDDFHVDVRLLRRSLFVHGYEEISFTGEHAVEVLGLPAIHKDPFDRALIAQAITEGVQLVTADPVIARYPCSTRLI